MSKSLAVPASTRGVFARKVCWSERQANCVFVLDYTGSGELKKRMKAAAGVMLRPALFSMGGGGAGS